ncbi:CHSTB-like protein [Mya arenaria]|uniref:Carbohydrate sulfotransferase n=1 Tax=Mya arenaria TaxID=6604 RepID=A0ABY7EKK7_MYAAR|nr:carbohydrate sulfotransferase 11-like [Mya arenaria]WAR09497.1 CHSTB-like protein [Mya arenaria]
MDVIKYRMHRKIPVLWALCLVLCILVLIEFCLVIVTKRTEPQVTPPLPKLRNVSAIDSKEAERLYRAAKRNEQRLSRVRNVCTKRPELSNATSRAEFWVSPRTSLAFCVVPKVGCTSWKRTIRFIEHDPQTFEYPSDISRFMVHYGDFKTIHKLKLTEGGQGKWIDPALKFMFSRDPYTRLWSAYLDKFVLPDFWHTARNAIPVVRQNVTKRALKCGHDMTFEEFVRYNYDHSGFKADPKLNEHFQTVLYNCNPCKHDFDVIGAAETFDEDTNLVLASAQTLGVIPKNPKDSRLEREITDLVDYNLDIVKQTHLHGNISVDCVGLDAVGRRLWEVFQYNGYLGDYVPFPEAYLKKVTDKKYHNEYKLFLKTVIFDTRKSVTTKTLDNWKEQRTKSMRNAFRSLPKRIMKQFQEMYDVDFDLFRYEKYPVWLESRDKN